MTTAFVTIVGLAGLLQAIFMAFYWVKIPYWFKNAYGRLSQLGAFCHVLLCSLYVTFVEWGKYFNPIFSEWLLISSFIPLVVFGFLQLFLLKMAIDSSVEEEKKKKEDA